MWKYAYDEIRTVIGIHHPQWLKQFEKQNQDKIDKWVEWGKKNPELGIPPGIITVDNILIDGNHRLEAIRILDTPWWCNLVEWDNGYKYIAGAVIVK